MNLRKFLKILLTIFIFLWMTLIFYFSNQNSSISGKTSTDFLCKIVEVVKGRKLSAIERIRIRRKYSFYIRKLAHFFLYFVLGAMVYILLCVFMKNPIKTVILAIFICFLYACTDEFHQLFIPGRTSKVFDVMVDTCGSMLSISFILLFRSFINLILCIFNRRRMNNINGCLK